MKATTSIRAATGGLGRVGRKALREALKPGGSAALASGALGTVSLSNSTTAMPYWAKAAIATLAP